MFVDSKGNYTAGYLESYDDPSKGSLFYCINPISFVSKTNLQMQQLQKFHAASITRIKQQAILRSPVTQRQQVDQLFLQGRITPEQAKAYYQQIEYAQLIAQAQKQAKKIRKEYCKKSSYIPLQKLEKAIEVMMSDNVKVLPLSTGVLTFMGKTSEGLHIMIHYDVVGKRIISHYPDSEKF